MKKYKVKFKTICECTMEETLLLLEEGKTPEQIRTDIHQEFSNNVPFWVRESWFGNEVVFDSLDEFDANFPAVLVRNEYSVLGTIVPTAFIKTIEECEEV